MNLSPRLPRPEGVVRLDSPHRRTRVSWALSDKRPPLFDERLEARRLQRQRAVKIADAAHEEIAKLLENAPGPNTEGLLAAQDAARVQVEKSEAEYFSTEAEAERKADLAIAHGALKSLEGRRALLGALVQPEDERTLFLIAFAAAGLFAKLSSRALEHAALDQEEQRARVATGPGGLSGNPDDVGRGRMGLAYTRLRQLLFIAQEDPRIGPALLMFRELVDRRPSEPIAGVRERAAELLDVRTDDVEQDPA